MSSLTLHNLKSFARSRKKIKRIGRGTGSGHGTYAGRGQKGQKARSGVSGLKVLGFKRIMLRTPKLRGFKSLQEKMAIVNIADLEKRFPDNAIIDSKKLVESGLVNSGKLGIKVLGKDELKKKFVIKANAFSEGAKAAIIKAGGKIIVISQ